MKRKPLLSFLSRCASPPVANAFLLLSGLAGSAVADAQAADKQTADAHVRPNEPVAVLFNPALVRGKDGMPVDLSRYERGNAVAAGLYQVDVYLNQSWTGRQEVRIRESKVGQTLRVDYCFTEAQLTEIGIDLSRLPDDARAELKVQSENGCVDLQRLLSDTRAEFDLGTLRLDLVVPQIYLTRASRGYVEPQYWDSGVTAGFVDYNANGWWNSEDSREHRQFYLGLNAGVNAGEWRLRHNGGYSAADGASGHYTSASTYVQRDVTTLKSQLTVGQYFTQSTLFDSVPYSGVLLVSDDRMLPETARGFAPAIRGIAESNARVTVRQGNLVVYETTVAPGPFLIDDLYSTGYAGDLNVTVTEADGRVRSFTVPYASVAQLLRPGSSRYSLAAGRYRDDSLGSPPYFVQATWQQGLSNLATAYFGGIVAEKYVAGQLGIAVSTSAGALAADVTHSRASGLATGEDFGTRAAGESYRLSYSKLVESTKTNFVVAGYRFSSVGYLSFSDYTHLRGDFAGPTYRQRNRFQANISQPLGEKRGSVFVSGTAQNYWNAGKGSDTSYQAGYANNFGWGAFNLTASRTIAAYGHRETIFMLSYSTPLGRSAGAPSLNASVSNSDSGDLNSQLGVTGSLGEGSEFNYGAYANYGRNGGKSASSGGANAQYATGLANMSASASAGRGYRQISAGATGSVTAHSGGLIPSNVQGETRVIIEAPGADGARIMNGVGTRLGAGGYGVTTGLTPYRRNEVSLDPKGMSEEVELHSTSQQIAPRYGAIVLLNYRTTRGMPLLIKVVDESGSALPVGAAVRDESGADVTMVGQGSRIFVRANGAQGQLDVRWGVGPGRACKLNYIVPEMIGEAAGGRSFRQVDAVCRK